MSTARAVTERHIRQMQHCIGLDYKKPTRGKYEAYRNYFVCGSPNETWEHLVGIDYAECNIVENERVIPPKWYQYSLTQDGLDFMGVITGCKITVRPALIVAGFGGSMTNYELIKNMSIEDLATTIVKTEDLSGPDYCKNKKECEDMLDADIDIPAENCVKCCLDWLKEESLLAVKAIMQEPCYELNSSYQAAVSALVATGMDKDMAIAEVLTIISELDKEQKAGWKKRGVSYV